MPKPRIKQRRVRFTEVADFGFPDALMEDPTYLMESGQVLMGGRKVRTGEQRAKVRKDKPRMKI